MKKFDVREATPEESKKAVEEVFKRHICPTDLSSFSQAQQEAIYELCQRISRLEFQFREMSDDLDALSRGIKLALDGDK